VISQVLAIASAVGYYLGFATPGWLRTTWQFAELKNFLVGVASRTGEDRLTSLLDKLAPAAARAVGAKAVVVMLARDGEQLMMRSAGNSLQTFDATHSVIMPDGVLARARSEREAIAADTSLPWGNRLTELATSFGGARSVIVCPLSAHGGDYGLLVAFFEGRSLFLRDEVELLKSLAEQAAFTLDGSQLYAEAKQAATKRLALHSLSQAIAAENEIPLIGQRLMEHISQLLPGSAWDLSLFTSDGDLEIVAAKAWDGSPSLVRRPARERGVSALAVPSDGAVIGDNLASDPDFASLLPGIQSLLAAPLKRDQTVIGVLRCFFLTPAVFTQADVQLAEIVATDVAVAAARAELMEHLTVQNLELEKASRLKSQFLANMSHELRTPLNAILGFSELLQDGGEAADTRLIYLRTIHDSGAHLLALINDILDLAKVEAGQMDLHLEEVELEDFLTITSQAALDGGETVKRLLLFTRAAPDYKTEAVDLGTVLRDAARLTAPHWRDAAQAEGRPISLQIEVAGNPIIQGSRAQLRELMTNLIFNAVDALPTGGAIRLKVVAEGGQGLIEVADSGVGMNAEVQARVFEPFFTTKGEAGTGLGLAMVFRIVEQHGGLIEVRSEPAAGTTFSITFPLVEASAGAESPPKPAPQLEPPCALRILVVDDEPMMTKAVARMLKPSGHLVSVAGSGEEALEKLADQQFDVVVSDVGMGIGMNGWELAEEVKSRWPAVRFLLATGWGAALDPGEAWTRGVETVLSKPYQLSDLLQALAPTDKAA
jgi:signal transduction histidine kinase